jgi:hypothetical protein
MDETGSAFGTDDLEMQERQNSAPDSGRRLLRRSTPAETEQIARDCPPEGLSVPVIVDAIRRATRVLARDRVQGCHGRLRRRRPCPDGGRRLVRQHLAEIGGKSEGAAAKALRDIFDLLRDAAALR